MPREALALAAGVLIALGTAAAQQPSARGAMPLPARAAAVASALGLPRADPALLPIDIVRLLYSAGQGPRTPSDPAYFALQEALGAQRTDGDEVPLPLTPAIWRTRLLRDPGVADERLALRIFTHRDTALLYYGLYAMDDPTLAWIASHEEVLDTFKRHPGLTAAFGRSLRIRDGTVVTPGSPGADAIWGDLAAAQPGDPAAFIARLFESHAGRLALLYDAVAQLDAPHQRFALIAGGGIRARALLQAVIAASPDWVVEDRPLFRPPVDVALLLRAVRLDDRGGVAPPAGRALWEQICDVRNRYGDPAGSDVDAAWLAACILDAAPPVARTRLTAFLFAQRAYAGNAAGSEQARLVEVVRAVMHYPALILTLERSGVGDLEVYEQAARRTASIERLRGDDRRMAFTLFQGAVALIDRARWAETLTPDAGRRAAAALFALEPRPATYGADVAKWIATEFLAAANDRASAGGSLEIKVLRALSGVADAHAPVVEWERRRYRVDPAAAEFKRLQRIRARQGAASLDAAAGRVNARAGGRMLADTLAAIVYAIQLGDPDGSALSGGRVWARHEFDAPRYLGDQRRGWRVATEMFGADGWRLTGSLLALEGPLAPLALRRMDANNVPPEPRLSENDRRTIAHTAALLNPYHLTDSDRDRIAAALARGRARVAALAQSPGTIADVARESRIGQWRTRAIEWRLARGTADPAGPFTLLELLRLGGVDVPSAWGTVAEPSDGCLCLEPPDPIALDDVIGRSSSGQLGRQFDDVMLRLAEVFAARKLPAALVRDAAAIALQDVLDGSQPYYFDDLLTLSLGASALPVDRIEDYVSALTATGPLVPVTAASTGSGR
ncbi:MAG: hypothetical protein DMF86_02180 [Acidobacteria bacterium]|nr:MAG: hypothetical protein DMF86_02180 [Acidobacteriota bacterium]